VSGPGSLTLTARPHNADLGTLVLQGANTYSGGTTVNGGTLRLSGSGATLGSADVTVVSASAAFTNASARITIETGVLNALADTATLSLAGGNVSGVADDGFIDLQFGVNEVVRGLLLGGVEQPFGTYGSSFSTASFKLDEYFSGPGIVTVIPEPGTAAMLLAGLGGFAAMRRRR
jgi:autotransporter-associated beta strand protein